MTSLKDIRLFTTQSHPCSYLPGLKARTLFIDPEFHVSPTLHTHLSEIGFRRSGPHMYRPHCEQCQLCVPCRVDVSRFQLKRRFRRILKRNADLEVRQVESIRQEEHYQLYAHYIDNRHRDGDMYPANREQFESFLASACDSTLFFEYRQGGRLLGVMVCDRLENALSAVYTYYDHEAAERSLGVFAVLWQIEEARRLGLTYLYLGYWIKGCAKMDYKIQYRPIELFLNGKWVMLN